MTSRTIRSEEGFTQIPHYLLEALMRANLTRYQLAIVFAVIRETKGFQREMRQISLGRIHRLTGISKRNIRQELECLKEMRILIRQRTKKKNKANLWGVNTCVAKWPDRFRLVQSLGSRSYAPHSAYPMRPTAHTPMRPTAHTFREGKESRKILIKQTYREATMEMIVDNPYFNMFVSWMSRMNVGKDQTVKCLRSWNKYGEKAIRRGLASAERVNSDRLITFWKEVKKPQGEK